MPKNNRARQLKADRAGFGDNRVAAVSRPTIPQTNFPRQARRPIAEADQDGEAVLRDAARCAMTADRLVTRLLHQVEQMDTKIARLVIALRGYEHEPVNPFPELSGREIIAILHPADLRWPR